MNGEMTGEHLPNTSPPRNEIRTDDPHQGHEELNSTLAALRRAKQHLDNDIYELAQDPPVITDEKGRLIELTLQALKLSGRREMLEEVASDLGLTKEVLSDTLE